LDSIAQVQLSEIFSICRLTVHGLILRAEAISRLVFASETSVKTRSSATVKADSSFDRILKSPGS
jgi:hypothetical protein